MRYHKDPLASVMVLASHAEQPKANADRIMLKLRVAYEKLKSGTEDDNQFDQLAAAINVGAVRAEKIAPEAVETMTLGVLAMANCARIQLEHGRYGFNGPDIVAMNDCIELYEGILRLSTPKQMTDALHVACRRMEEV